MRCGPLQLLAAQQQHTQHNTHTASGLNAWGVVTEHTPSDHFLRWLYELIFSLLFLFCLLELFRYFYLITIEINIDIWKFLACQVAWHLIVRLAMLEMMKITSCIDFLNDVVLKQQWLRAMAMDPEYIVDYYHRVCSKHFAEACIQSYSANDSGRKCSSYGQIFGCR